MCGFRGPPNTICHTFVKLSLLVSQQFKTFIMPLKQSMENISPSKLRKKRIFLLQLQGFLSIIMLGLVDADYKFVLGNHWG